MSKKIEVSLAGRTFSIKTDDSASKVQDAADMVQQKIDQLRALGTTAGSDRLMTLVALNLAGELLDEERPGSLGKKYTKDLISSLNDVVSQAETLAKGPLR